MADELSFANLQEFIKVAIKKDVTDPRRPPISEENLLKLTGYIKSTDTLALRLGLELLGDMARTEAGRYTIQKVEQSVEDVVKLMSHEDEDVRINAVRLLGNLCFNNPEPRKRIQECENGLSRLVSFLNSENPKMLRMACGCIANACSNSETNSEEVVRCGAIPELIRLLKHDAVDVSTMAARAITNVTCTENICRLVSAHGGLNVLVSILSTSDEIDVVMEVISAIGAVIETRSNLADFIDVFDGLELLMKAATVTFEGEEDIAKVAFTVMQQIAEQQEQQPKFIAKQLHKRLLEVTHQKDKKGSIRADALKVIGNLSVSDSLTSELFPLVDQFTKLIGDSEVDVRLTAMLIIGNLARTDENCVKLIEQGVAAALISVLDEPENKTDTRPLTMAAGALKNLALYPPNKERLLKLGVLSRACKMLESETDMVVYCGNGIIKVLLMGGETYAKALMEQPQAIDQLIKLSFVANPEEKRVDHVLYECARTLATFCSIGVEFGALLVEKPDGLKAFITLLQSKFAILHQEALLALLIIASKFAVPIANYPGMLDALFTVAQKEEKPIISKEPPKNPNDVNVTPAALRLIDKLVSNSESRPALVQADVMKVVTTVAEKTQLPEVKKLAESVASKLKSQE